MKKIGLFVLLFLLIIPVGLIATSHFWLRQAISRAIYDLTGFPVTIKDTRLNLLASQFGVYGVELKNPKSFADSRFASIPEIYVDFDLSQLFLRRNLYFKEIRLDIEEISIVRNASGQTNIAALRALKRPKTEMEKETIKTTQASSAKALDFFIEELVLTIRRLRYEDQNVLLSKTPMGQRSIDLHIENEVFRGISHPADIVRIIVVRIIHQAAIGNLDVPVAQLKEHLDSSLALGQKLAAQGTDLARDMGVQALDQGQRLLEEASEKIPGSDVVVKETVEDVRTKAKGLFQGAEHLLKDTTESLKER